MGLQQIRVEQVKAQLSAYANLGQQMERMSPHRIEIYIAAGGETTVTLPNGATYMPGTSNLLVFRNGDMLTANDYTETSETEVTFGTPLNAGDKITFVVIGGNLMPAMDDRYQRRNPVLDELGQDENGRLTYKGFPVATAGDSSALGPWVIREVPAGVKDGVNRVFQLANIPVMGSEMVFLDGVLQHGNPNDDGTGEYDYWIDYQTGTITFHPSKTPRPDTIIQVTYLKA